MGGAGFLAAPDLVLTCAHVVSDAAGRPREEDLTGAAVTVDLPLDEGRTDGEGPRQWPAVVENWVPIRSGRAGDIAVLRLTEPVSDVRLLPMADPESVLEHGALAVGFTDGEPGETWFRGRFAGGTSEGWLQLSRADGVSPHIRRGFSGSPVWDTEEGAVVGLMVAAQPERDTQQGYVLRTRAILRELPELARVVLPPSPFRGLKPFLETDGDVYFGRDEDADHVVTALRGDRGVVTLYGPSGCGKSSLALAGVLPRMRQEGYEVLTLNAGRLSSPLSALATELSAASSSGHDPDTVERWLAGIGLVDTFHRVRGQDGDRGGGQGGDRGRGLTDGKLVVVLDQAEALLGDDSEAKMNECADLLFSRRPAGDGLRVLVVLRSDFMDAVLKHPRLGPALHDGVALPLTPMTREQLEAAITKPLERVPSVSYDPGLDRRILEDTGGDPGILPLLGFVLQQLWEGQSGGRLLATRYEAMGGVSGALESHSDRAWKACIGDRAEVEREALGLLTSLVRMLPGGTLPLRRRLSRQEAGEERWRIAQALAERRLLVLHGGRGEPETAELAHESLIATWPVLRRQVAEDAKLLAGRAELSHDRDRWERDGRPTGLLPGAFQLRVIRTWLGDRENELGEGEKEFLAQARRRSARLRRRARAGWTAVAVVLSAIVGLGTFILHQRDVTEERAAEGRSRALATLSDGMATTDQGLASLASVAAYEVSPTQEARNAMLRRYNAVQDVSWSLTGAQGEIAATAMSSDGGVTLVTSSLGRATLFVRTPDGRATRRYLNLTGNGHSPMVSGDGRKIAYMLEQTGAPIWHEVDPAAKDVLGPARPLRGGGIEEASVGAPTGDHKAGFSPSGQQVVVTGVDRRPRVGDLRTGQLRQLPEGMPELSQVWFADEDTLVGETSQLLTDLTLSTVAVDLRTGKTRELTAPAPSRQTVGVSGNGQVLAVCRNEGEDTTEKAVYQIIGVTDGRELIRYTPPGSNESCLDVAFDMAGDRFAVGRGGYWATIDTRTGTVAKRFVGRTERSAPHLPLLGGPDAPMVVTTAETAVTGSLLWESDGATVFSPPELLDHGKSVVVRVGRDGARLRVAETTAAGKTLAEVTTDAKIPPNAKQPLAANRGETLVADVADENRIVIRALPGLRKVTEFRTAKPPKPPKPGADKGGNPELVEFHFTGDKEVMTVSGPLVEHWNAETGERLSAPLDVRDLRREAAQMPAFTVGPLRRPGFVQVHLVGETTFRTIDLRTGKEDESQRVDLGRQDVISFVVHPDQKFALLLTSGSMVEMWSFKHGRLTHRVQGPIGPLAGNRWTAGALEGAGSGSGFYLANGKSVLFQRGADPEHNDSYDLGERRSFLAGADQGRSLLMASREGGTMQLLRLDPALWKRHLCAVFGRELDADERAVLPKGLPKTLCPT
ncbi:trypsin-like peptidase domain-containing protein [Streptomyces sp. 4.24]|uniref:nSTAND1 domain-containing NTPase n=1 Tax=Streptomyces tritrimontium TaxID=3406573 RepID=UPI003BB50C6B